MLENYHIGHTLDLTSNETIVKGLEEFVHVMSCRPEVFEMGLKKANDVYSQSRLVEEILEL